RQIALARRRRPHTDRLVAAAHVERCAVGVAVDGDGRDPHFATGARDAHGDLSPIRDEDLADAHAALEASLKAAKLIARSARGKGRRFPLSPATCPRGTGGGQWTCGVARAPRWAPLPAEADTESSRGRFQRANVFGRVSSPRLDRHALEGR